VVTHEELALTSACLASVAEQVPAPAPVILVDNGSKRSNASAVVARFPEAVLVTSQVNLGFAGGANLGIRRALAEGCDYVWLLNNDTVCEPGALATLLETAGSDERIAAVGSVLVRADGSERIEAFGGGEVSLVLGLSRHTRMLRPDTGLDFLSGASLLLRCRALREVGALDEGYFLYWEDVDLSFRLRQAGWRLAVATGSRVVHAGGASIGYFSHEWDRTFTRSAVRFFRRHAPAPLLPILAGTALRCLWRVFSGHPGNARAILSGLASGLRDSRLSPGAEAL